MRSLHLQRDTWVLFLLYSEGSVLCICLSLVVYILSGKNSRAVESISNWPQDPLYSLNLNHYFSTSLRKVILLNIIHFRGRKVSATICSHWKYLRNFCKTKKNNFSLQIKFHPRAILLGFPCFFFFFFSPLRSALLCY